MSPKDHHKPFDYPHSARSRPPKHKALQATHDHPLGTSIDLGLPSAQSRNPKHQV